jgi:DNA-binding transcriptional regulator YiaG
MGITKNNQAEGVPYTMSLSGGRTLFVRVPAHCVKYDRSGEMLFTPEGMRFLDNIKALAMQTPDAPSPAYIRQVRVALKMTQAEYAQQLGYSVISIKKWEAGDAKPGKKAVDKLRELVQSATSNGVVMTDTDSSILPHGKRNERDHQQVDDNLSTHGRGVHQRRIALRQAAMNGKRTLCEVLKESGISQAEFARLTGLSPSTVSRFESTRIKTIKAIDKVLG